MLEIVYCGGSLTGALSQSGSSMIDCPTEVVPTHLLQPAHLWSGLPSLGQSWRNGGPLPTNRIIPTLTGLMPVCAWPSRWMVLLLFDCLVNFHIMFLLLYMDCSDRMPWLHIGHLGVGSTFWYTTVKWKRRLILGIVNRRPQLPPLKSQY